MLRKLKILLRSFIYNHNNLFCEILRKLHWKMAQVYHGHRRRTQNETIPANTYYIIKAGSGYGGLFAHFHSIVGQLAVADANRFIPVIDMEGATWLADADTDLPQNVWEYFFVQPRGISAQEARLSKNTIDAAAFAPAGIRPMWNRSFLMGWDGRLDHICKIVERDIHFNESTQGFLERSWASLGLPSNARILGVLYRGTDYAKLRPVDHPIQPTAQELIDKAHEIIDTHNIDHIFLKSEEKSAVDQFRKAFGDKLIHFDAQYFDDYNMGESNGSTDISGKDQAKVLGAFMNKTLKSSKLAMNLEYIRGIWGASRCNVLLAGLNMGTVGAVLLNGGRYEQKYIMYSGVYS